MIFAVGQKGGKMGRLLDEDDVIDWVFKRTEMHDAAGLFVDEGVVMKNIEAQIAKIPSAQPEIIRCRDCKFAHITNDGRYCKYCDMFTDDYGQLIEMYFDSNFYCGYAERK